MASRIGLARLGAVLVASIFPLLAPVAARADGPYVIVSGALEYRQRAGESSTTYTDLDPGFGYGAIVGDDVGHGFGVEGEFSRMTNWTSVVAATATGPGTGFGYVTLQFYMLNGRFTFPTIGPVQPYVGAGVGVYKSYINGLTNPLAASYGLQAYGINQGAPFAYQVRAGVAFHVIPYVDVLLGYRFLRGGNLVFNNTQFGTLTPNGATTNSLELGAKLTL